MRSDLAQVLETLTPQDCSLSTRVLFENSFRKLGRENQSALDIFTLLAFLNPTSLSQQVFRELDDSFLLTQEKIRSHQSSSSLRVRIAKQRLLDSGLLRENTSTRQYSLHDLTHLFLRERLSQEEKDQCIHATIDFIWRNLPEARNAHVPERWETASRYVSHAVSVVEHAKDLPIKPVRLVDILIRTAGMLVEQGFTDKATELAVNAFEYSRGIQDCPHAQRSKCLSIIGYVFNYGGSNSKTAHAALPFYEDAYDIDRVQLGDDHEDTITDLHNLGGVQRNTGDWQTAQKTFEEVIQKGRRLFMDSRDSLHPYASMISLGEILREQNKFLDSIKLLREAEEGLRKRQSDKSSWTLYCTTELGKALLDATLAGVLNARDEAQRKLDTAHKGLSEVLGDEDEYTKSALAAFGKTQDLDPPLAYQA
jgi:tetratricopeptide (TPR) repeat protein